MTNRGLLAATLGIGIFLIARTDAWAQNANYSGKTVRIAVGYVAGTEYDNWGRLVARHIGRHLNGNPKVIVENMPGAGSMKATSYLFAQAPKDGTVFGAIGRDVITLPLIDPSMKSRFDPLQFNWLGSPSTETNACVANASAGLTSAKDLFKKQLIVGGTGAGTGTSIYPRMLNGLLGTKFRVADGYKSSTEVLIAMQRKEVDGVCQSYSYIRQMEAQSIASGRILVLLQGGGKPDPQLKDVFFAPDLASTTEQRQGLEFLYGSQAYARPFVAPPGLPEGILASLRSAFEITLNDPQFVSEAKTMNLDLDPVSGQEVQALVKRAYEVPIGVVELFRSIMKTR